TLTFNPGESSKSFTIRILDDAKVRGMETIGLTLTNGSAGVTLRSASTATLAVAETDGTHTDRWLAQVYLDLLHRQIDDGGLTYFDGLINQGVSRTQVVQAIESSGEYRTNMVQSIYQRYLRRAADPSGLATWVNFLGSGGTDEQLEAAILG